MAEQDAQLLQILIRQVWEDRLVDRVLSENCLVLLETKAPQPPSEVHADALIRHWFAGLSPRKGAATRG